MVQFRKPRDCKLTFSLMRSSFHSPLFAALSWCCFVELEGDRFSADRDVMLHYKVHNVKRIWVMMYQQKFCRVQVVLDRCPACSSSSSWFSFCIVYIFMLLWEMSEITIEMTINQTWRRGWFYSDTKTPDWVKENGQAFKNPRDWFIFKVKRRSCYSFVIQKICVQF